METTIRDFYDRFGFNWTRALLSVLYEDHPDNAYDFNIFMQGLFDRSVSIPDITELLPLMCRVNKMVKHPSCPNNIRNRFYAKKKQVIRHLQLNGLVDSVIESDGLYKFVIGDYAFHQLKKDWERKVGKVDGTEVYEPDGETLPFSMGEYVNFRLVAILYVALGKDLTHF